MNTGFFLPEKVSPRTKSVASLDIFPMQGIIKGFYLFLLLIFISIAIQKVLSQNRLK